MELNSYILVAGVDGFVRDAITSVLIGRGYTNTIAPIECDINLLDSASLEELFIRFRFDYVFLIGGKSGGILANQRMPAQLMLNNLLIDCNVISLSHKFNVKKLLYLASSCIYPREADQPIVETSLMTGRLEPTNEAYATAKIAGLQLCRAYNSQYGTTFVVGVPSNPFGPGDDFSEEESHVIPGLIRRMHEAKIKGSQVVEIWGTGRPKREFIYSHDLADACVFVMNEIYDINPINIAGGEDVSIRQLAILVKKTVGFEGSLVFDETKPDGMPFKGLDPTVLAGAGWGPKIGLSDALRETYDWYLKNRVD